MTDPSFRVVTTLPDGTRIEAPGPGYRFSSIGRCRGCEQPIAWFITPNDKRGPYDLDGTSHFATCPKADRFR